MAACFVANAIPALGDRVGSGYSMHKYRYWFGFARTLSYDAAAKEVLHAAETSKRKRSRWSYGARLLSSYSIVHYESHLTCEARLAGVRFVRTAELGSVA